MVISERVTRRFFDLFLLNNGLLLISVLNFIDLRSLLCLDCVTRRLMILIVEQMLRGSYLLLLLLLWLSWSFFRFVLLIELLLRGLLSIGWNDNFLILGGSEDFRLRDRFLTWHQGAVEAFIRLIWDLFVFFPGFL